MKTRKKSHATTIVNRPNGCRRVYYWIYDYKDAKFIRKSKDFSPKAVKLGKDLSFARDRDAESKLPEEITVSMDDRVILNRLRKFGDLNEVLRFLDANYKAAEKTTTVKEAFDAFISEKGRTNRRASTISDYERFRAKIKEYHQLQVKDLGYVLAEKIILEMRTDSQRIKLAVGLSALYNWCIKEKFCVFNPFYQFTKSDFIKDRGKVHTMTVDEARQFLYALRSDLQVGFAIMLFAGVRPSEIFNDYGKPVLNWSDINFRRKTIHIRAETAKTHTARLLQDLPENLWVWLSTFRQSEGDVMKTRAGTVARYRRIVCKALNLKYAQDICRHSFASYGYHYLGAEHTVEIMGHIGGFDVFAKHYKGLATKDEATEFFSILPPENEKLPD